MITSKRIFLVFLGLLSAWALAWSQPGAGVDLSGYNLMYSQSPVVALWVSDKIGKLGKFSAEFVVTAPDGKKYTATRKSEQGDFVTAEVVFPRDFFQATAEPGKYTWTCRVLGRDMAHGGFVYKSVGSYANQLRVVD